MNKRTLARHRTGAGWTHPYPIHPFAPVLYADGGSEGGDASGTGDGDGGDASSEDGDGGSSSSGALKEGAADAKKDSGDDSATIRRLEKELADARREAGKDRTAAKQKAADDAVRALTEKLGRALGFVKEDGPPDPEKLAKAVAEKDIAIADRNSTIRSLTVQIAVLGRAEKGQFRAAALLDRTSFTRGIADLDPDDKNFGERLDKVIKAAVDADETLRVRPPAGRSGGDHTGSSGEGTARKRSNSSLAGAIRDHYQT